MRTAAAARAGFFIRTVLLGGSRFDDQVLEDTKSLYLISTLAVFLLGSMQFVFCWGLWACLPVHASNDNS